MHYLRYKRVTPLVIAPGDTNLSDATAFVYIIVKISDIIFITLIYVLPAFGEIKLCMIRSCTNLSLLSESVRYATLSRQINPVFHAADEQCQSNYLSSDFRRSRRFSTFLRALCASIIRRETLRVGHRKRAATVQALFFAVPTT